VTVTFSGSFWNGGPSVTDPRSVLGAAAFSPAPITSAASLAAASPAGVDGEMALPDDGADDELFGGAGVPRASAQQRGQCRDGRT